MTNRIRNLGLLVLAASLSLATCAYAEGIAVLKDVEGEVLVQKAGADAAAWIPVTGESQVDNGDSIQTKAGSCTLIYGEKGTILVQPNTLIVVKETPDTQDIALKLGRIRCKVDALKPGKTYEISTPVAVSAIRGTDVDFGMSADGALSVDLHDGNIQVVNDDQGLDLNLEGGNKITIFWDPATKSVTVKSDCASAGPVTFKFGGQSYSVNPCDEVTTAPGTAGPGELDVPDGPGDNPETEIDPEDDDTPTPPVSSTGGEESPPILPE